MTFVLLLIFPINNDVFGKKKCFVYSNIFVCTDEHGNFTVLGSLLQEKAKIRNKAIKTCLCTICCWNNLPIILLQDR